MMHLTIQECERVYREWGASAFGLARRFRVDYEDCKDVLQNSWIKFSNYIGKDVQNSTALFFRIVRTTATDWIRAQHRHRAAVLPIQVICTDNEDGYQVVGRESALEFLKRSTSYFPGADAQAVALWLEHGSAEIAAVALLERAGLNPTEKEVSDRAHRIWAYKNRFITRMRNITSDDLILLSLFDYKAWDIVIEQSVRSDQYKNQKDKNELAMALENYHDLNQVGVIARNPFNEAMSYLEIANKASRDARSWPFFSYFALVHSREAAHFAQNIGDNALMFQSFVLMLASLSESEDLFHFGILRTRAITT